MKKAIVSSILLLGLFPSFSFANNLTIVVKGDAHLSIPSENVLQIDCYASESICFSISKGSDNQYNLTVPSKDLNIELVNGNINGVPFDFYKAPTTPSTATYIID